MRWPPHTHEGEEAVRERRGNIHVVDECEQLLEQTHPDVILVFPERPNLQRYACSCVAFFVISGPSAVRRRQFSRLMCYRFAGAFDV